MKKDSKETYDVMAIPYNKPFIIANSKKQDFLSKKPDPEIIKNNEMISQKFKENNLKVKTIVLKKK